MSKAAPGGLIGCLMLSSVTYGQGAPAFEVASVRPASEEVNQVRAGLRITGSQVRIVNMSIKDYIGSAYGVKPQQIDGPDWIGQLRFDVSATIPEGVPPTRVPEMLRALLADRFQMKTHRDKREFPVYALGVARSGLKIKEAAPNPDAATQNQPPGVANVAASGTGQGIAVDLGGGSSFSFGNNRLEARRMTMADFAEMLTRFVDRPVINATNVTGIFDVTLDIAPDDYMPLLIRSAINAGVSLPSQALRLLDNASSDPLSAPLANVGLTLDSRKAFLDVIVVDAMQKTPTEN
jgi:uncharacterized protein (TIGR03435 family)